MLNSLKLSNNIKLKKREKKEMKRGSRKKFQLEKVDTYPLKPRFPYLKNYWNDFDADIKHTYNIDNNLKQFYISLKP